MRGVEWAGKGARPSGSPLWPMEAARILWGSSGPVHATLR